MKSIAFTLFLFLTISAIAQDNFIMQDLTYWQGDRGSAVGHEDNTVFLTNFDQMGFNTMVLVNKDYQFVKRHTGKSISKALRNDNGEIFALQALEFEIDFPPRLFGIQKLDKDLNEIYYTAIEDLGDADWQTCTNKSADFVFNGSSQILFFYWDQIVTIDIISGEILERHQLTEPFACIDEVQSLEENNIILLQNDILHQGIKMEDEWNWTTLPITNVRSFHIDENLVYVATLDHKFEVYDMNFQPVHGSQMPHQLDKINRSYDGTYYLVGSNRVYEIGENYATELVYENEFRDYIINAFKMNGEMGLLTNDIVEEFNKLGIQGRAVRKAEPLVIEALPDLELSNFKLVDQSYFSAYSPEIVEYSVSVEYDLKNVGTSKIDDFYVLSRTNPSCFWQVNYCGAQHLTAQDLAGGTSRTMSFSVLLGHRTIDNINAGIEFCISAVMPDRHFDKDYSDNTICETLFLDTKTKDLLLDESVVSILPNPTTDDIQIQIEQDGFLPTRLELFNAMGQLVKSENLSALSGRNIRLAIGELPTGMYKLLLREEERLVVKSVIKL